MKRRDILKLVGIGAIAPVAALSKSDCPTSIEELTQMIEARHKVGRQPKMIGPLHDMSVTGELYNIVLINGLYYCGQNIIYTKSENKAIQASWNGFLVYSGLNPDATLYWRSKPEMDNYKGSRVYMSFLLSDKPDIGYESSGYPFPRKWKRPTIKNDRH